MVHNLMILVQKLRLNKFIRRWFKMVVFANAKKKITKCKKKKKSDGLYILCILLAVFYLGVVFVVTRGRKRCENGT